MGLGFSLLPPVVTRWDGFFPNGAGGAALGSSLPVSAGVASVPVSGLAGTMIGDPFTHRHPV